jgi:sugar phosphate isomerase/epimerase
MKIAFSTLGCPTWAWEEILATASDLGFNGIEVRGIEKELYMPKAKPFTGENLLNTKKRLVELNLEIPIFTSACYLFDKENIESYINEGKEYIDLASKAGVKYVRVMGDKNPEPGSNIDLDFVHKNLAILGEYAKGKNVYVLIETNGVLSDSQKMLEMMENSYTENIGVLWDVHHPFRFNNESVDKTYETLKDYIKHIHIKDSKIENDMIRYKMLGYGDIPVNRVINMLKENDYTGYVSLEWVKRWNLELEEPGVVFSHFINYIKDALNK